MGTTITPNIAPPIFAENSVLATLIFQPALMAQAMQVISAESFGGKDQKVIAAALWSAYKSKMTINPAQVSAMLPDKDIYELLASVDGENFESNLEIVKSEYQRRQEAEISANLYADLVAGEKDYSEAISEAAAAREKLYAATQPRRTKAQQIENILDWVGKCMDSKGLVGIPTGYNDMNALTGGFQPGEVMILAARPSMGKTSYAVSTAIRSAIAGTPVLFLTCEMSEQDILIKANAFFSGISVTNLRQGKIYKDEHRLFMQACDKLLDLPFYVEDIAGKTFDKIQAIITEYKRQHGVRLVVIDYLQLITTTKTRGGNREQEIAELSRSIKLTAKSLNIAIMPLCQLSRAVETRGGAKRPQLSDLRESGAIEQDADLIAFLYRPEYYGILEDEEGNSLRGITEVIISKHRNGATANLKRKFVVTDFQELDEQYNQEQTNYNPTVITRPEWEDEVPF